MAIYSIIFGNHYGDKWNSSLSIVAIPGDFSLEGNEYFTFNSSLIGQSLCRQFRPINDEVVEDIECFTFRAMASDQRDFFIDNIMNTTVCIEDDDGKFCNCNEICVCIYIYIYTYIYVSHILLFLFWFFLFKVS